MLLDMVRSMMSYASLPDSFLGIRTRDSTIHTDLCGTISTSARGGYEYFVTFINNYSRYGYIYLMHHKSEAFDKFKEYKAEVENH